MEDVCGFYGLKQDLPRGPYPLPSIDDLVNMASDYTILSFCDAFSKYNQIHMWEEDRLKMTFIIDGGVFCYKVMLYGLKNVGATY